MSEETNKNDAQLSDERVDNLFRIISNPPTSISESQRVIEKVRKYLDKIYLDGFQEGLNVGISQKLEEL